MEEIKVQIQKKEEIKVQIQENKKEKVIISIHIKLNKKTKLIDLFLIENKENQNRN